MIQPRANGFHAKPGDKIYVYATSSPFCRKYAQVVAESSIPPGELLVCLHGDPHGATHRLRKYQVEVVLTPSRQSSE